MSLHTDLIYSARVAALMRNNKRVRNQLWNFSCPICGDSRKDKKKARGYLYNKKQKMWYKCHNCGTPPMSLGNFLKKVDEELFKEYKQERFRTTVNEVRETDSNPNKQPFKTSETVLEALDEPAVELLEKYPRVSLLGENHPCLKYVQERQIPKKHWSHLYFVKDLRRLALEIDPERYDKFQYINQPIPCLLLPFIDKSGNLQMIQGRNLRPDDKKRRYITLEVARDAKKIFGFDRLDINKTAYVFEGPIDSLFMDNGIATADSSLFKIDDLVTLRDKVLVYDNEPRNKDICKLMMRSMERGYKVVIWQKDNPWKDVNDMVQKGGWSQNDLKDYLQNNHYSGGKLKLMINNWKQV